MGRYKKYISADLIEDYKIGKVVIKDIARLEKCCQHMVISRLRELGVRRPKRFKISRRNFLIFDKYQNGNSICKLSTKFKVSRQRIQQIVSHVAEFKKVSLRKKLPSKSPIQINLSKSEIKDFYNRKLSSEELSLRFNCTVSYINKRMRECGYRRIRPYKHNWEDLYKRWKMGESSKSLCNQYNMNIHTFYDGMCKYKKRNVSKTYLKITQSFPSTFSRNL